MLFGMSSGNTFLKGQPEMPRRRKISCFVIVFNEAERVERCLASVASWVDQLVILDSGSTDGTAEICKRFTDEVHVTDWPGFGAQRNRALGLCEHDWVLNIDADEVASRALQQEILELMGQEELDVNLVKIPWRTMLFGRRLRFGRYSAPQGKLFLKNNAQFKQRSVHETLLIPDERIQCLQAGLDHYSWRDYKHLIAKHLDYATLSAGDKFASGKRCSLAYAYLRFFTDFFQQYVLRLGFLDGWRGLLMAGVLGQYAFHKYACLWSLHKAEDPLTGGNNP